MGNAYEIFNAIAAPVGSHIDVSRNDDIQFEVCAYGCAAHMLVMDILIRLGVELIEIVKPNIYIYGFEDEEIMVVLG